MSPPNGPRCLWGNLLPPFFHLLLLLSLLASHDEPPECLTPGHAPSTITSYYRQHGHLLGSRGRYHLTSHWRRAHELELLLSDQRKRTHLSTFWWDTKASTFDPFLLTVWNCAEPGFVNFDWKQTLQVERPKIDDLPRRTRLSTKSLPDRSGSMLCILCILCYHSPVKLFTVGSRAFSVAAAQLWNSLPDDIVLVDSLWTFRRQLKHQLFQQFYPDVVL